MAGWRRFSSPSCVAARILEVRQRLEEAYAVELAENALVNRFVSGLSGLPEGHASALLRRTVRQYRETYLEQARARDTSPGAKKC